MYNRRPQSGGYNGNRQSFRRPSFRRNSANIPESHFIKKASGVVQESNHISDVKFTEFQLEPQLQKNIAQNKFENATAIQAKTILPILEGKDVIGIANTGTGKTAAFLIPLLNRAFQNRRERVLIVVPTRELASQIRDEMRSLANSMQIYPTLCIGGSFLRNQVYELQRNPQFVIGTPGRLKDLIERKVLNLSGFTAIVLDEVDRMLDMGFVHDIKYLISLFPQKRQSLFFSATLSSDIRNIISSFTKEAVMVSVKTQETTANVDQDVIRVNGAEKFVVLEELLKKEDFKKVLIFGRTKMGVEKLSRTLYQRGFKVASIHGDKPQSGRNQAIRLFKEDVVQILVATDVASRGIDIPDITHVINYDQPATYDDYVHRIGRTGRANKKGIALTFV
ncbi:MAG: DEAD/DEAH box helicase [Candidatus Roizmanbacteria bacterium]